MHLLDQVVGAKPLWPSVSPMSRWFTGELLPVLPGLLCWCRMPQQCLSSSAASVSFTLSRWCQVGHHAAAMILCCCKTCHSLYVAPPPVDCLSHFTSGSSVLYLILLCVVTGLVGFLNFKSYAGERPQAGHGVVVADISCPIHIVEQGLSLIIGPSHHLMEHDVPLFDT